jgi:hypothetical protein
VYSRPSWFQKYFPTRQRSTLATTRKTTMTSAAGRVNSPSASSGPPTSWVTEIAGAQNFPGR